MYEITVDGGFCATHRLRLADGTLEPVHGHDWTIRVCLVVETLDASGFVADFERVREALSKITNRFEQTDLNDHPWLEAKNPTAERVARVIFDLLSQNVGFGAKIGSVRVGEAAGCAARYSRSNTTLEGVS